MTLQLWKFHMGESQTICGLFLNINVAHSLCKCMHISWLSFIPYFYLGVTLFVRVIHLAASPPRLLSVSLSVCLSVSVLHFHKHLIHQWQQLPLLMFDRLEVIYRFKWDRGKEAERKLFDSWLVWQIIGHVAFNLKFHNLQKSCFP